LETAVAVSPHLCRSETCALIGNPLCPLCQAMGEVLYADLSDWLFGIPGTWNLKACSACEIAWLDPRPAESDLPKLYARYYTHTETVDSPVLRQETVRLVLNRMGYEVGEVNSRIARVLSHISPVARTCSLDVLGLTARERGRLLDVGCGSGDFVRRMRSLGWDACGVDPDPGAVGRGRETGLQICEGTIADLGEDERYDVITLNHVIEHVPDAIFLLTECRKRLRDQSGILLITTPNIKALGHKLFKRYWRGLETPRHLILFSPAALSHYVSDSGLRVRSIRTETRLARMIFNQSLYAKRGTRDIGARNHFSALTKWAAYGFQLVEDALWYANGDMGEEIYCVCTREA
jgi:2-polyprenyl-3-methyl-5-hydroxy-6-metoxy-1,4-benzoquinol methylase